MNRKSLEELLDDYRWTWDDHHGDVLLAAGRVNMKPTSLSRALYRARQRGYAVRFYDNSARKGTNG